MERGHLDAMRIQSDSEGSLFPVSRDNLTLMDPPDCSELTEIQRLLSVELWSDDEVTVGKAVAQLASACSSGAKREEHCADVHRAGGACAIVGAMRKYYKDPYIQAEGGRVLAYVSWKCESFRDAVSNAGGIFVINSAMKNHCDDLNVQRSGCILLCNLAWAKENICAVINKMEGHKLIITAMKKFPNDIKLLRNACGALHSLLAPGWPELHDLIVKDGGRRALFEAIDTHVDETVEHVKEMQFYGRKALKALL